MEDIQMNDCVELSNEEIDLVDGGAAAIALGAAVAVVGGVAVVGLVVGIGIAYWATH